MDDFIFTVFSNADDAHRAHLATESFAQHEALGEFYGDVREALDSFVEAAIGLDVGVPEAPADMVAELESGMIDLASQRERLCQDNPTLLNKFDEITGVYARALFKLKRLK